MKDHIFCNELDKTNEKLFATLDLCLVSLKFGIGVECLIKYKYKFICK
jgi:hypothetical protein